MIYAHLKLTSMAQNNDAPILQRRKRGVPLLRKQDPKTDMTPMVDLGFLLITFFVITTEMNKPGKLDLLMPKEGKEMHIMNSTALTVLLTGTTKVYYYHGNWETAKWNTKVYETYLSTLNGIGN